MTTNASPEPKIVSRRRWPWVLAVTVLAFLAGGGIWILLQSAITPIAENAALTYAHRYGIEGLHLDIRQITPWKADIQTLQIDGPAPGDHDQLRMDSLGIDYSPWGLKAHIIDGIKLSGLVLKLEKTAVGWNLAGLPPRLPAPTKEPNRETPQLSRPDWRINHLEIRNSRLEIVHERRQITVPFEFQAHPADESGDRYRGQLVCRPGNQSFKAAFVFNRDEQRLIVEEAAAALDVQQLSQLLAAQAALPFKGRLTASGRARLALSPLKIEAAEIQIRLPQAITHDGPLALRVLDSAKPLATVKLDEDRTWALHAPGIAVTTPEHLQIVDWRGRLEPADRGWRLGGGLNLNFDPRPSDPTTSVATRPDHTLPVTYKGRWQTGEWALSLAGQGHRWEIGGNPGPQPAIQAGQFHFTPHLDLTANGQKDQVEFEAAARLVDFKGLLNQNTIRIPTLSFQVAGEGPWHQFQGRYDINADNFRVDTKVINGRLPQFSVAGALAAPNGHFQISGQARLSGGTVRLPDQQIRLDGLRLELPFTFPHAPSTADGRLRLAAATWNDLALGAVAGRIRQQPDGADFRMTHHTPLLPGGKLQMNGRLRVEAKNAEPLVDIDYRFERPASPDDVDLGQLSTQLAGVHFNGRLEAQGHGAYQAGQMHAGIEMKLAGGRLVMPEQKSGLVGLKGRIAFPDLLAMRSAPGQQLFFERAYIGDIAATDGQIGFQVEPGRVFFLEQGRLKWCGGSVHLPATRIAPQKNDYALTLWCDRLKLAPILEQLGAARAEGGGTVSGRIPVRIRKGQFLVDNGFLYSSPGEGGTIRLHGTEMLTAGIPPGTPQYNQLELARQALREYDYDWVKLSLETAPQEDLLRLKLQLNGQPSNPLPFIYDTQAGGFIPAGPGSKGSRFEEIKLDVNFSLPLNRLLEYKNLLKLFS